MEIIKQILVKLEGKEAQKEQARSGSKYQFIAQLSDQLRIDMANEMKHTILSHPYIVGVEQEAQLSRLNDDLQIMLSKAARKVLNQLKGLKVVAWSYHPLQLYLTADRHGQTVVVNINLNLNYTIEHGHSLRVRAVYDDGCNTHNEFDFHNERTAGHSGRKAQRFRQTQMSI